MQASVECRACLPLALPSAVLGSEKQMQLHLCIKWRVIAETSFAIFLPFMQTKLVWYAFHSHLSALDVGNPIWYLCGKDNKSADYDTET